MRERLRSMGAVGVQTRTFHAAALRQLRYFWPQVAGNLPWTLLENKFRLVAQALRKAGLSSSTEHIRDVISEIEWAKANLLTPETYPKVAAELSRESPFPANDVATVFRIYEELKTSPDGMALDFDDLLLHTAAAIENNGNIASEFRARYRSFVVDEYQDVTPLQQRVLQAWLGDRDDLTVVGDANQTIYSFTGATPQYLLEFPRTYPHATLVRLQRDYRSTPQVVELANNVIGRAQGRVAGTRLQLEGQRPSGPEPIFEECDNESTEAMLVVRRIQQLIADGTDPGEIAILLRINAQSAQFEEKLTEAGLTYRMRGGEGFFQRPEIRQSIDALVRLTTRKAPANDDDTPSLHRSQLAGQDLRDTIAQVLAHHGLTGEEPSGQQARDRYQSLAALRDMINDYLTEDPELKLGALLDLLRRRKENNHPPSSRSVTIATIHSAKGLEWDAVFVIGLTEGTMPNKRAIKAGFEAIEEERRLFYVAITRAREYLHLSWAKSRQVDGPARRRRTRFLDGIVDAPAAIATTNDKPARASNCPECHQRLRTPVERVLGHCDNCAAPADRELTEELREWRRETAKANDVSAFVILTDASLRAICEQTPQTREELLKIPGIGPAKLEQYGSDILEIIGEYGAEKTD